MVKKFLAKNLNLKLQILLSIIVILTLVYSFALSLKRYNNYEYGKFDLGNMSQMVWNSGHGRFMEVTDQFGTNMPRWGMSHVDPILLVFVPIYWVYDHPMIMVFIQQIFVLSAAFALYRLVNLKTNSSVAAFLAGLIYTFYPAIGYTLIWTTYHGISFVAPILIWVVYLLEKNKFVLTKNSLIIYWLALVVIILGKEQIGLMTALCALFLYKRNKKLAIQTFIVSMVWFIFAFFILIPAYAPAREISVNNFINEVGITNAEPEEVQGDNFFLVRYSHLGDSYGEMLRNLFLKPRVLYKAFAVNLNVLNDLFGPLGYIVIASPFWLISLPDVAISMLSNEQIFGIDNHRIGFIISALFISYVYLLVWIQNRYKFKAVLAFSAICLISTIYFSYKSSNPLFISATSFVNEKIVKKIFAQKDNDIKDETKEIGSTYKGIVPRNDKTCLDYVVKTIYDKNPNIYTGPDYLGAHTSHRYVNALFPGRISDADMIVADLFDEKAIDRVGADAWFTNKSALEKIVISDYKHLFSCGMLNVFEKKLEGQIRDAYFSADRGVKINRQNIYPIETSKIGAQLAIINLPSEAKLMEPVNFEIGLNKIKGGFSDSVTYWKFKSKDTTYSFIDYMTSANSESIDSTENNASHSGEYFIENISITFPDYLKSGDYEIYYGIGDLVRANEVYLGNIKLGENQ